MKLLFVHSWQGFCLAEWYLRDAISNNCETDTDFRAIDIPSNGIPANDNLVRMVFSFQPDIVGFSCHYWSLNLFLEASRLIKKINPEISIILGGPQVNSVNAASLILNKNKTIDFIIRGPGEVAICRLIESLNESKSLASVPGLSYRDNGNIKHNEISRLKWSGDLIFHKGNKLLNDYAHCLNEISYETTRGCYMKCAYCYYPADKFEIYDDEKVLSELKYICDLNVGNLRICDTHFGGTKERAKRLLSFLKNNNHHTSVKIYPDLNHIDYEYLKLIKESGAQITSVGIQTTNPAVLKKINRYPLHKLENQIHLILKEFPDVAADLITQLPGDTLEGLEKTFTDILQLGFSNVNIFRLMIFPGTELSENISEFYDEKKLLISNHGHLVSSTYFPVSEQKKVSSLTYALEIICWIIQFGKHNISINERVEKFKKLISSPDNDQLIDLYQKINTGHRAGNEETPDRTGETVMKIFNALTI